MGLNLKDAASRLCPPAAPADRSRACSEPTSPHDADGQDLVTGAERKDDLPARMKGKIAVVIGGAKGIGLATARRLAAEGARVFITGRDRAEVEGAAQTIGHGAQGGRR